MSLARDLETKAQQAAAEASILRSEQRYKSVVLASSQVVWSTNPAGEVVEDLPSWRSFTGQTTEELLGRGWMVKIHPDDMPSVQAALEQWPAVRNTVQGEFRVLAAR